MQAHTSSSDKWYYPSDIANDLEKVDLPTHTKEEVFACAWEYSRCVIPRYTNWARYMAFMRIIIIGTIAEFRGTLVDVAAGNSILGYDLESVLDALFAGTPGRQAMAREYRSFLLITAEKSSKRINSELFQRYTMALADSPRQWFRLRDNDALARFTIAAALACNDLDDMWYTDEQFETLTELGDTMYDAVAFFKHRAEGETNNTFAYMPSELRIGAFGQCRELLWALDVAWRNSTAGQTVINFVRLFGGPIHMMMRRYRFVEEGLTLGQSEDKSVVAQAQRNLKLWNRVEENKSFDEKDYTDAERFDGLIAQHKTLMFPGLAKLLTAAGEQRERCARCSWNSNKAAFEFHRFGGVELCAECKLAFAEHSFSLPYRATKAFPELERVLR